MGTDNRGARNNFVGLRNGGSSRQTGRILNPGTQLLEAVFLAGIFPSQEWDDPNKDWLTKGPYSEGKVTPDDPVPEPSTFLLLGAGLFGIVFFQRKREVE